MKNFIVSLLQKHKNLIKLAIYVYHKIWIYDLLRILNIPFNFKIGDVKIRIYPQGQISKIIFMNKFEQNELEIFSRVIKPGMIVVDAGANIGLYSILASKIIGKEGQVYSFEPSIETFRRLNNNIKLNKLENIIPINMGLGDQNDQELTLRQDLGYEDAERYLVPQNFEVNQGLENVNQIDKVENIKIITLDSYLKSNNVKTIDILKIDTEGFEYYILNGAKSILKHSENLVLFFECTDLGTRRANTSQEKVFEILFEFGFYLYYWNENENNFSSDLSGCYSAGEIWATKSKNSFFEIYS